MKIPILIAVLLVSANCVFSQCNSTVDISDKVIDVQNKLNCFAAENSKLSQALEASQRDLAISQRDLATSQQALAKSQGDLVQSQNAEAYLGLLGLNPRSPSSQECFNNAKLSAAKYGWEIAAENQSFIAFHVGKSAAVVICQSMAPAYIIVGGKSKGEADNLKNQLMSNIFPTN